MTSHTKWYVILATIFGCGILAVYVSEFFHPSWFERVLEHAGVALMIASLLGVTVDRLLKLQVAEDVFMAAFRYVLPGELKEEVARIIGYKFIVISHLTIIEIVEIQHSDLVRVTIKTERTIKNISSHTEQVWNYLALDEWGMDGHNSILGTCRVILAGETIDGRKDSEVEKEGAIGLKTEKRDLTREMTAKLITEGSEVHRTNSQFIMAFDTPAVRPSVVVRTPAGFGYVLSFGVPGERITRSEITAWHTLDGTQFPGQSTRLRWWKEPSGEVQLDDQPTVQGAS
jgi:hypothetical protein